MPIAWHNALTNKVSKPSAGFVIITDILNYGSGIDPVQKERELIRRKCALLERRNRVTQNGSVSLGF